MTRTRVLTIIVLTPLLLSLPARVHAQRTPLQQRLAAVKTVNCTFNAMATGTWTDGTPSITVKTAPLTVKFRDVNLDEGSADAEGAFGPSFIVVRQTGDYLHLVQMYGAGPLYTTTVLARETKDGRLMAVHSRVEFTDVAVPGFTSRPEMYVGDCVITP